MSERGQRKEEERDRCEGKRGIKDERTRRQEINRGHRGQN
jgi:hypothetical protein